MTVDPNAFLDAFATAGGDDVVGATRLAYLASFLDARLESADSPGSADLDTESAYGFESLGLTMLRSGASEAQVIPLFERAFRIRSAVASRSMSMEREDLWMLLASGTMAQRQPELRLQLARISAPTVPAADAPWDEVLWSHCQRSAFLLARRGAAWRDVEDAVDALRQLAELQRDAESMYLRNLEGHQITAEHCRLLGLYHLAEMLLLVGAYLRTGHPDSIMPALQRHGEHVRLLFGASGDIGYERVGESSEAFLVSMVRASIWFNTSRLSEAAAQFAHRVASIEDGRTAPVTELWWSQRTALRESLLDPYKGAVSVQMPTSAGKTLLAEFAIVQSLALNPESTVAYVVPTRALVNQITRRLRTDLAGSSSNGRSVDVEAAVPAFELDPTENTLLSTIPHVLVTTPEKLDLLVRARHPAVEKLSLVVVDEAHHIADQQRGPRLELLLATLKYERGPRCRFLLLTPFLPNASELSGWLGDAEGAAIQLDWTPSEQIRALGHWSKRRREPYHDTLELLPSVTQPRAWTDAVLDLGLSATQPKNRSRPQVSASLAIALSAGSRGGALVLTQGPGTAEQRAQDIATATDRPLRSDDADLSLLAAAKEYVVAELGETYVLSQVLDQGVAYHHAGMPPEVRALVEVLLERGVVKAVAGTTTLAQGVNFPLSSVIVETLNVRQGRGRPTRLLRYSEFWNIAGRAGRALKDAVGIVAYPSVSKQNDEEFRSYLRGEAAEVVSALAGVVATLDQASTDYGLALVRSQPALSNFLQYLTHALNVAGYDAASAQMEDLLRSSLAFHELRSADRATAERLVRWCRDFLAVHRSARLIPVADTTGLSLPSVGLLAAQSSRAFSEPEFWQAENLFGANLEPLTQVVELLGQIPEMSLAPSDEAGQMNALRVAGILRDWVQGRSLPEIASEWFGDTQSALQSAGRYLYRELSGQIPWGMGALQTVALTAPEDEEGVRARQAPALAFYGVDDPAALPLRMVGVPRSAALVLGPDAPKFNSFLAARDWVAGLTDDRWANAGASRSISGEALRRVWLEVGGSAA